MAAQENIHKIGSRPFWATSAASPTDLFCMSESTSEDDEVPDEEPYEEPYHEISGPRIRDNDFDDDWMPDSSTESE